MKKYASIKGRLVLSEEEIKLLREAQGIVSEVADYAYEYANGTTLSYILGDLDCYLDSFCQRVEATGGDLYFEE